MKLTSVSKRRNSWILEVLIAILFTQSQLFSQITDAQISGVVQDESDAVVPGVTVTATEVDTGLTRTVQTDARGNYLLRALPPGRYDLKAEHTGFRTIVRTGLQLRVGDAPVIRLALSLGEVTQSIVVSADAPLVATTSSHVQSLVETSQIRDLPLNGRDFTRLARLESGVVEARTAASAANKGAGVRLSISGARPYQTGYLLDGTDISTNTNFGTPGSAAGVVLGVDTVREFRILVNSFSAEFGNAAGGVINAVTRSGTNAIHGTVFEFLRNDVLDARNFYDVGDPPPFKRNQFGFTAGGPIRQDKAFYFGSYEGFRQRLGQTLIARVPTAEARLGQLPEETITVAEAIKPYLPLWPLPNGRDFGDGTAEFSSASSVPTTEDYWLVKTDFNLSETHMISVRFIHDDASVITFDSPIPNAGSDRLTHKRFLAFQDTVLISPNSTNVFRVSLNRTRQANLDHFFRDIPSSLFLSPGQLGAFTVGSRSRPSISNPLATSRNPRDNVMNLFQYQDTFNLVRGEHNLKFGTMVNRYQLNGIITGGLGAQYTFSALEDVLTASPRRLRPGDLDAITARGIRQWLVGIFVVDEWNVRPNLNLNLGLRYEFITVPTEVDGLIAVLPDWRNDTETVVGGPLFKNPSLRNFAPRVGFSWDIFGTGNSALRGGFGIYHDQLTTNYTGQVISANPPFSLSFEIRNPIFPDALLAVQTQELLDRRPEARIHIIDPDTHQPYLMQYNLSLQQAIGLNQSVTLSYIGSHGVHLQRNVLENPPTPVFLPDGRLFFAEDAPRINPIFSQIFFRVQDGISFFNSLQVKFNRRLSSGLQFQVSYRFSKTVDDGTVSHGATDFGLIQVAENPFDRKFDRGLSNIHIAHNFTSNYVYELPWLKGSAGWMERLLGGWQLAGILSLSSGSPFHPIVGFDVANIRPSNNGTRPNLKPGADNNPVLGGPDRYFDSSSFELQERGFLGNLGRNTIIGPGVANLDFILSKNFRITERANVQFRTEVFNLFNRANFATPSQLIVFDSRGRLDPAAGRITETVTTSRQLQFGLRVTF